MQVCTKTPTNQCGCRVCRMDDLSQEHAWLLGMSRSGAMSQIEVESRLQTCLNQLRALGQRT